MNTLISQFFSRSLLLLIVGLCIHFSTKAQQVPYREQKISIKKARITESEIDFVTEKRIIDVSMQLTYKYSYNQVYKKKDKTRSLYDGGYSYYLVLKDKSGKVINNPSATRLKFNVSPTRNNESGFVDLEIFYCDITKYGKFEATLELHVRDSGNHYSFPPLYAADLNLDVPKQYAFNEQEFSITNLITTADTLIGSERGLYVGFQCAYLFEAVQLRFEDELDKKNRLTSLYYFFLSVQDSAGNLIYEPYGLPYKGGTEMIYMADKPGTTKSDVGIFVPGRLLKVNEGSYNLTVQVLVTDYKKSFVFDPIVVQQVHFKQMPVYEIYFRCKELTFESGSWDRAFFEIGNVGKGYPDIVWGLSIGENVLWYSPESTNSYEGYRGIYRFTAYNDDSVKFFAYDEDIAPFSGDDYAGSMTFRLPMGDCLMEYKNLKLDRIEEASVVIWKRKINYIPQPKKALTDDQQGDTISVTDESDSGKGSSSSDSFILFGTLGAIFLGTGITLLVVYLIRRKSNQNAKK